MKRFNKKGQFSVLMTFIVVALLTSVTVSADPSEYVATTLAIGSSKEAEDGFYDILSSVYDPHLGGNDFNQRVMDHLLLAHKDKTGQDLSNDDAFLLWLASEVETAKRELSVQDWVQIDFKIFHPEGHGFSERITRSQFEDLNRDLFTKTITAIDQALQNCVEYTKEDIQDILFAGGSSRIPFLQSAVREYFGPHKKVPWWGSARNDDRNSGDFNSNKMYTFTTTIDNQDRAANRVFRLGDGTRTGQTTFLGGVELRGIAPAPKGVPQIRVKLIISKCGSAVSLNVMDVASGTINGTIFSTGSGVGQERIKDETLEGGEIEPAGKLIVLPA
ncbi:ATPase with role in protein import into the ER [Mortierella antarctica]|nr:ATPase with role in protein import into the ER [Mortierella antarctica]